MPENGHDRLDACPALGELGAHGMAESVGGDGGFAVGVDESGSLAGDLQTVLEQVLPAHGLAAPDEHPADPESGTFWGRRVTGARMIYVSGWGVPQPDVNQYTSITSN